MTKHEFGIVMYTTGGGNLVDMSFSLSGMPDEAKNTDYIEAVEDLLRDATPATGHSIYHKPVELALKAWTHPGTDTSEPDVKLTSGYLSDEQFKNITAQFPADVLKHIRMGNPETDGAFQYLAWHYSHAVEVNVLLFSKFTD